MSRVLQKIASIKKGTKNLEAFKFSRWVTGLNSYGTRTAAFFVFYVDALLWLENEVGWSVNWTGANRAEWKLCASQFVNAVGAIQHSQADSTTIKNKIMEMM